MRKTLSIGTLAALTALLLATTAPGALAQDSGVDQYIENPGTVPETTGGGGGGGSTGGGGGSTGGGGSGGGSAPAPSEPSVGSAPAGGTVEQQAAGSGTTTTTPGATTTSKDTASTSGDGKSEDKKKKKRSADDKSEEEFADPVFTRAKSSAVEDSGSSGLGIALPIILGVLLLGAGIVAAVRIRRAKTSHA